MKGDIKKLRIDLRERQQQITSMEREINDMDKDINRITAEKSKAQARSRTLENELRITKAQVDELVSANLDNEKVIRVKVACLFYKLILGLSDCITSGERSTESKT